MPFCVLCGCIRIFLCGIGVFSGKEVFLTRIVSHAKDFFQGVSFFSKLEDNKQGCLLNNSAF